MDIAKSLISLTLTICALNCVMMAGEYLLPSGPIKSSVGVGTGILFLSAVIEQIAGIFAGNGV